MLHTKLRTIVAFSSELFDLSWPSEGGDPNVPPLGRDAAVYFYHKLAEKGVQPVDNEPVMGETSWHWQVSLAESIIDLFVHWAPMGQPPVDKWAIQPKKKTGCLAGLLGKHSRPEELMPFCIILKRIIEAEPRITNVEWFTDDEFRKMY